ncbi:Integration host factor subunit beta [Anaerobiospirillum thomasii]|uniref:Integration host factor subunit beta n=1 Tax=Anaerobiospirillum thomasii TaxID=179995 RepID=A0A2X0VAZ7_9GAMM|nr:HU family DNA-binding protein [Anaerobiospirillum thomasii]SPT68417.1 Integration host factor subunit beta [Anaerobiospirillum thomasii]SPT70923.1 Integration host factor subunit beta [Anaerobiospirillum thomasii]
MTRADLINTLVAKYSELPPALVDDVVRELFEQMIKSLASSQRIEIRGFGSFEVRVRAPRVAHNPKTGQKVEVGERRVVHFKPGVDLKEKVNSLKDKDLVED